MLETLMMVLAFLGGGGMDLAGTVDTDAYWKAKGVTVSVEQLLKDAKPAQGAVDVAQLIADLGADDFPKRKAAKAALLAIGQPALEQLRAATTSKVPEVGASAREIVAVLETQGQAREIRQLMAIRTLGEKKTKEAVPELTELSTSTAPFVADYAKRSLAQIDGREVAAAAGADRKGLADDVWLMPAGCGVIAQQTAGLGKGLTLGKWLDLLTPVEEGVEGAQEKEKMKERATKSVIGALERVGNVRIDAVSLGVGGVLDDNHGFGVVTLRGKWDKKALALGMRDLVEDEEDESEPDGGPGGGAGPMPPHMPGGPGVMPPAGGAGGNVVIAPAPGAGPVAAPQQVIAGGPMQPAPVAPPPVLNGGPEAQPQAGHREALDMRGPVELKGADETVIVVSDEQMIVIGGEDEDRIKIAATMMASLKSGKGGVAEDQEMSAALKAADMSLPVWGVMRVTDSYRALALLAPFKTVTLAGLMKGDLLDVTITGTGRDDVQGVDGLKLLTKVLSDGVKELTAPDAPDMNASEKRMLGLLQKIQVKGDGSKVTAAGTVSRVDVLAILEQLSMGDLLDMLTEPSPDEPAGGGAAGAMVDPVPLPPVPVQPMPR